MQSKYQKFALNGFFVLVCLALTSPLWVSKQLLFPYVTTKAFVLRLAIELALPFYVYFLFSNPSTRPNLKRPINLAVLGFVLTTWISAFFGDNFLKSVFGNFERMGGAFYVTHLALLYFYILFFGQWSSKYLFRLLQFFIFISFVICANGVIGWLGGPTLVLDPSLPGRASSTLGNPIYLGAFAILPMFFCLYFIFNQSGLKSKIIYSCLGLLFLTAMLQSGTRGALVGVLIGLSIGVVLYIIFNTNRTLKRQGILFVIIGIVFFGYLFWQPQVLPKGSVIRRIFELRDSNTNSRLIQWQSALEGFKDSPFFGVGPENYYIISNQYYNPENYQYDRSWFDKPHNFPLEILVTGGIINFIFYVSIIGFAIRILFFAFKQEILSLSEFCVLMAGLVAYLGQNMFVFDTVPTSVAFYVMLGLVGVLDILAKPLPKIAKPSRVFAKTFQLSVVGFTCVLIIYSVYYLNWLPILAAKSTNYGLAYATVSLEKTNAYFAQVINNLFNFDVSESSSKYADALLSALSPQTVAGLDKKQVVTFLQTLEQYLTLASQRSPYDPIILEKLASVRFQLAYYSNSLSWFNDAITDLEQAIALAPKRVEARESLAQIRIFQGNNAEALRLLEKNVEYDSYYFRTRWLYATLLNKTNQIEQSLEQANLALKLGYKPQSISEINWLIGSYVQKKDFKRLVELYELVDKISGLSSQEKQQLLEYRAKHNRS